MRVVVAPDKFRGSVTAPEAAAALSAGLRRVRPDLDVAEIPVADGGEGTVAAALAAGFEPVAVTVEGPLGEPVTAVFALRSGTAVIELASATGLRCLPEPGPTDRTALLASTYGVGQLLGAALDRGARTIVLGIGGSASTDGGAGMVQALGVRLIGGPRSGTGLAGRGTQGPFGEGVRGRGGEGMRGRDGGGLGGDGVSGGGVSGGGVAGEGVRGGGGEEARGRGGTGVPGRQGELRRGGAALAGLAAIDLSRLDPRLGGITLLVASDVDNPLLGPDGAAAVFGPQKGAGPDEVRTLERGLRRWAELTVATTGKDLVGAAGAGAAGGTGFAALAYLGATLVPGVSMVLDLVGFDAALNGAELVVTGEGCLDRQTLGGKAPLGVAMAAGRRGVPVVTVAGQVLLGPDEVTAAGFSAAYALSDAEPDLATSMARARELLEQAGARIAAGLAA